MDKHYTIEEMNELWKDLGLEPSDSIPPDATFVLCDRQARQVGTGYQNYIYKMFDGNGKETGHALIVNANCYSQFSGFYNDYSVDKNYFSNQKQYAREVGALTKQYGIPFDTGLSLCSGLDSKAKERVVAKYATALTHLNIESKNPEKKAFFDEMKDELMCGINRRTKAIEAILGGYGGGQVATSRIAKDCIEAIEKPISKDDLSKEFLSQALSALIYPDAKQIDFNIPDYALPKAMEIAAVNDYIKDYCKVEYANGGIQNGLQHIDITLRICENSFNIGYLEGATDDKSFDSYKLFLNDDVAKQVCDVLYEDVSVAEFENVYFSPFVKFTEVVKEGGHVELPSSLKEEILANDTVGDNVVGDTDDHDVI